ncbi:glycosyl hydrolase [candidate division KSB1 bacterium]|nr:MAG: glycosyl hydrolase [candidate division KSB1 bacterium]
MDEESFFKNLKWRSVGPLVQGGRITDIDVPPGNHFIIYVASASGGLWKTVNNGTTWKPIFDHESSITIGDIAIAYSNPDVIWVGTGENNSSRSSYAGTGVFKSTDGGKTWKNMGLTDSHHIGRIVIDPDNENVVYVASIGHLYTPGGDRGVYKTTNGGITWEKILTGDGENTGFIDLLMNPVDHKILYAAAWERSRKAWNFVESGEGSGIYKTTDGGITWKKLKNGLPSGKGVGRIGLSLCYSHPEIIYTIIDNQNHCPEKIEKEKIKSGIPIERLEKMTQEEFLKIDIKKIRLFLKENKVPKRYTAEEIIKRVEKGKITPKSIAENLRNANERLFRTNVIGAEVYRSDNGGKTWKKVNKKYIDNFYNTYGYYFGNIRVHPQNPDKIFILGVPILYSEDGGKTFKSISKRGVHADHHALWIDPRNPDRLIDGNDGGLNFSYDGGKTWQKINNIPLGQFYTISYDMEKPYNIYGGLQDNGVMYGPVTSSPGITKPWEMLIGGDGGFVQVDPVDTYIVYAESQFGFINRVNRKTKKVKSIRPESDFGEPALRFNWLTPFIISPHNRYILYLGAQKLFKSYNRGDTWYPISPDLTDNNPAKRGDVPYGTITAISESPLKPGLIYVGTDDGNVHVTMNGGAEWIKINKGLPKKWVTRIVASQFNEATVYVTLTGYRDDDFDKYIYISDDYGKNWKFIGDGLPHEPINVVREDPTNENILYAGTDLGVYCTLDKGKTWHSLNSNLPVNAMYDIKIHPRDGDIMVGTHGRSVFVMNLKWVRSLNDTILAKDAHLFKIKPVTLKKFYRRVFGEAEFVYFLKEKAFNKTDISIIDSNGNIIKTLKGGNDRGFNFVRWNLKIKENEKSIYIKPGNYTVKVKAGKIILEGILKVIYDKSMKNNG